MVRRAAALALPVLLMTVLWAMPALAMQPVEETIHTDHGVSLYLYNPCAADEFVSAAGYLELQTVRRSTTTDGVRVRTSIRPLEGTWHWYGWRTTDPDFDPTIPHAGDPDFVYAVSGSTRDRATIETVPGSATLTGSFVISGSGPSSGISVLYTVTYMVGDFISAEVTELALACTDGSVVPIDFTYFP
jgi:hypothetical protein